MRRLTGLLLCLLLLTGCAQPAAETQYDATFLNLFDTVTTIKGWDTDEASFSATAQTIQDALLHYHQLFDIYHDYEGLNNLKTVNDNAGIAPVSVDSAIIALLLDCKEYYDLTGGRVNVAMGSLLSLWHTARETGILPQESAIREAMTHCAWDTVLIDEAAGTVFLADPGQKLDVGAVAKGWAAQRVAEMAPDRMLLSVGGNVCATGPKTASGAPWVIGVENPDGGNYIHTLNVTGGSVVTSGDYQRYFLVGDRRYHHIIDPDTGYPARYWRAVTVLCADSGLADALSTALFLLPQAEGQAILTQCNAQAMWIDETGACFYSEGFRENLRT